MNLNDAIKRLSKKKKEKEKRKKCNAIWNGNQIKSNKKKMENEKLHDTKKDKGWTPWKKFIANNW